MPPDGHGGGQGDLPLVLEVYSNSEKAWLVGIVLGMKDGMVTVRFFTPGGEKRQKAALRQDPLFATLGSHTGSSLPPGIVKVPSTTRKGQESYYDQAAQRKFATPELAWHAYLEKHLVEEIDTKASGGAGAAPGSASRGDRAQTPVRTPRVSLSATTPAGPPPQPAGDTGGGSSPSRYIPEGPAITPPASPRIRRGGAPRGNQGAPSPQPPVAAGQAPGGPSAPPDPQLVDWVAKYVQQQQPVVGTTGINYLSQVKIVFDQCTDLFVATSAANQAHRDRIIAAIESGAFMRASLDVFVQCEGSRGRYLTWDKGRIRDYVVAVFTRCNLSPPAEGPIQRMFQAFDVRRQQTLNIYECLLLVDAIARCVFRPQPPPGRGPPSGMDLGPPNGRLSVGGSNNAGRPGAENPNQLHGQGLAEALGTASLAQASHPLLAVLCGVGRDAAAAEDSLGTAPYVYSSMRDHGGTLGPTEVRGVGVVDGAISIARLLVQKVPASVLSGSPQGEEVKRRLQAKAAAAVQAAAANGMLMPQLPQGMMVPGAVTPTVLPVMPTVGAI